MRRAVVTPWVTGLALLVGCEGEYQGAPTPCDHWCRVTQRAGCEDDWPDNCVQGCARRGNNQVAERCPAEWQTLIDCHDGRPASDYYCDPERSRPQPGVCETERTTMQACGHPDLVGCFEQCDRAAECGFIAASDCYDDCINLRRACGARVVTYFQCVRAHQSAEQDSCDDFAAIDVVNCPEASAPLLECLDRRNIDVFEDAGNSAP